MSTVSEKQVAALVDWLEGGLNPFEALGLDYSDLGMVIGPFYDNDEDIWKIAVNVRTVEQNYDADLNLEYTFEGLDGGTVLDEIYPEFVRQIEERYDEMQLQYTDPEI